MSTSAQLDSLGNDFNNLITQYQNTYQAFITTLSSSGDMSFNIISNSAYVGDNYLDSILHTTSDNCVTACGANALCAGATFDNTANTCILSSDRNGSIIQSANQMAIIKQSLYYSNKLKELNDKLIRINTSIMNLTNDSIDTYTETKSQSAAKAIILNNNYRTLEQERYQIEEMINSYATLDAAYSSGDLIVTSNYYTYVIYTLIAIFLGVILVRFNVGNPTHNNNDIMTGGSMYTHMHKHMHTYTMIYIFLGVVILSNAIIKGIP